MSRKKSPKEFIGVVAGDLVATENLSLLSASLAAFEAVLPTVAARAACEVD